MSSFFKEKVITVIGGTGSIGSNIVNHLLKHNPKTIRILSNSENELWETELKFKEHADKLRFLLGDIRDYERIKRAVEDVDYVFNAAAIKHVPVSEYNPMEAINVNIHGLENIIEACFSCKVKKLIHISTDKAVSPTTVMGATKMLGERLCSSRELTKGTKSTIISCVRFGNVLGSRGSIIPLIKQQIKNDDLATITDEKMKRFFLSISQAVELVLKAAYLAQGGEIFVLKMPTVLIKDLIEVIIEDYSPIIGKKPDSIKLKFVGTRPGEKFEEELISPDEYLYLLETKEMYVIYPLMFFNYNKSHLILIKNGAKEITEKNFCYNTKNNPIINKNQIRTLMKDLDLLQE